MGIAAGQRGEAAGTPRAPAARIVAALLAVLALTAAGCGGSQLSPAAVRAANLAALPAAPRTLVPAPAPSGPGPAPGSPSAAAVPTAGPPAVGAGSGSGSGPAPGQHPGAPTGAVVVADHPRQGCSGLRDQPGITARTITIANASDISGPVPGIFTSARQATQAFAAYFNATSRLCGRTLQVLALDTRTDAGGDQQAALISCQQAFAAVGSMSAFDSGGAATVDRCGLPDLRSQSVSDARNACAGCFGAQATEVHAFQNAVPDFLLARNRTAAQHAAMIYVGEAASVETAKWTRLAEEQRGMRFVYGSSFDVAEFNYAPYVQALKDHGARVVQFIGSTDEAVRFARAMQSGGYHPDAFVLDPTAYDPQFLAAGSAVEGALVYLDFLPFEEAGRNAEMRLYLAWLQQVAPGAVPSYFGLFAWSAARLFTEQAQALGSGLTRAALVRRLRTVTAWTDHGLHGPQPVGPKRNSSCWRFVTVHDGRWVPAGGTGYLCHGSTVPAG